MDGGEAAVTVVAWAVVPDRVDDSSVATDSAHVLESADTVRMQAMLISVQKTYIYIIQQSGHS